MAVIIIIIIIIIIVIIIIMYRGVGVMKIAGSRSDDWIYWHFGCNFS
jgi:hypothetical protein